MTRAEFLQGLKTELEGRVPYSVIQENIRYYDSYILDEVNKGADEAEVIESLGGPQFHKARCIPGFQDRHPLPVLYQIRNSHNRPAGPLYQEPRLQWSLQ